MSKEYPLYDKMAQRFYRWEVVGDCKMKSFEPDMITCGVPEKTEQPKKEKEAEQKDLFDDEDPMDLTDEDMDESLEFDEEVI